MKSIILKASFIFSLLFAIFIFLSPQTTFSVGLGGTCFEPSDCDSTSCMSLQCSLNQGFVGTCTINTQNTTTGCCETCGNGVCEPYAATPETAGDCGDCSSATNSFFTVQSCTTSSSCSTTADGCCPNPSSCPSDPDCNTACSSNLSSSYTAEGGGGCISSLTPPVSSSLLQAIYPYSFSQWFGSLLAPGGVYLLLRLKRRKK